MELGGFIGVSEILRSGVYALVYRGAVVYIGKSKVMLGRIYTHRSQWGRKALPWLPIKGILFDEVFVRPCTLDQIDELEYEMINLYKPRYNVMLKHNGKSHVPITLMHGDVAVRLNQPKPRMIDRRI